MPTSEGTKTKLTPMILTFVCLVILDQLTKIMVVKGLLSFHFDSFSSLPMLNDRLYLTRLNASLKNVFLATETALGFFFVIVLWWGINKLRYAKVEFLFWANTFFTAGLTGNLLDRFWMGAVVDFIHVRFSYLREIVFNVADMWLVSGLWFGLIMCVVYRQKLWIAYCKREKYWLNPTFQKRFLFAQISILSVMMFCSGSFVFILVKSFTGVWTYALKTSLIFGGIMGLITLLILAYQVELSMRICGPVYALKSFLEGKRGDSLKLRQEDFFEEFEQIKRPESTDKTPS